MVQDPGGDEPDRVVEQGGRAGRGGGLPGVALVADPDVPVVVVPAGLGPFRAGWWWRRRPSRRWPRSTRGAPRRTGGHPCGSRQLGRSGTAAAQAVSVASQAASGSGGRSGRAWSLISRMRSWCPPAGTSRPAISPSCRSTGRVLAGAPVHRRCSGAAAAGPGAVRVVQLGEAVSAETGPWGQGDPDLGVAFDGDDAAEQDRAVRVTGERQGFPAFDDAVVGDPAAAPDHAALFVEAAPDEPVHRGDRVPARSAEQRGEDRVAVPPWRAHPDDVARAGRALRRVHRRPAGRSPAAPAAGTGSGPGSGSGRGPVTGGAPRRISAPATAEAAATAALVSAARR